MMGRSLELGPEHLSQEPHYIHEETSDASADSDLMHIHGHGCVPENGLSISMDTEELVGEANEMMDMAAPLQNNDVFSY
jgi:hypothetical protein